MTASATSAFVENAPAKVNLTLRVLGRRADGYHDIESLVGFADFGDTLSFAPGGELALTMRGPNATLAGPDPDNLVVKAARSLAALIPGIRLGAFELHKRLPVAAGLGGGSADAAAALRLLARANVISSIDVRLYDAARATGADVPVCLDPQPRLMRGIGEKLSAPLALPPLPAVLVNPRVALATKAVFAGWTPAVRKYDPCDPMEIAKLVRRDDLLQYLMKRANDLEFSAIALAPALAEVLQALRALPGRRLVRMSGSGATCFAVFASAADAIRAGSTLHGRYPHWWVRVCALGGVASNAACRVRQEVAST
ncbi:MAG: 4-(cytidine 5'-diphospho)-2-C-methyl-D-erythritol kinase [Xanthobacteraceae bacterium]